MGNAGSHLDRSFPHVQAKLLDQPIQYCYRAYCELYATHIKDKN